MMGENKRPSKRWYDLITKPNVEQKDAKTIINDVAKGAGLVIK